MNRLIEYIKNNSNKVIAIDGPSGSGKSTIAKKLEEEYDVLVFHTDDYFLSKERKTEERINTPGGNLDYERLEDEILKNLDNSNIQSNYFNCQTNLLEVRKPVKRKSIILIEGVYSLHPQLREYYDFTVYIDVDRETQLNRIKERSGDFLFNRFVTEWIPLEDKYFSYFDILKNVDLYIEKS